jgi:hypothetical protein
VVIANKGKVPGSGSKTRRSILWDALLFGWLWSMEEGYVTVTKAIDFRLLLSGEFIQVTCSVSPLPGHQAHSEILLFHIRVSARGAIGWRVSFPNPPNMHAQPSMYDNPGNTGNTDSRHLNVLQGCIMQNYAT